MILPLNKETLKVGLKEQVAVKSIESEKKMWLAFNMAIIGHSNLLLLWVMHITFGKIIYTAYDFKHCADWNSDWFFLNLIIYM